MITLPAPIYYLSDLVECCYNSMVSDITGATSTLGENRKILRLWNWGHCKISVRFYLSPSDKNSSMPPPVVSDTILHGLVGEPLEMMFRSHSYMPHIWKICTVLSTWQLLFFFKTETLEANGETKILVSPSIRLHRSLENYCYACFSFLTWK